MPQLDFETYNLANARDLGGLPVQGRNDCVPGTDPDAEAALDRDAAAENRQTIKPGLLIRSCALGQATEGEIEQLREHYDPHYIIDLRAESEAKKKPDPMQLLPEARYFNLPLAADDAVGVVRPGGVREFLALGKRITEDPVGYMRDMYADIISSERGQAALKQVFDILLEANGACVFWHCTAGKDRAGIVAALILLALGASRETIYEDYLLTNKFMQPYLEKQEHQFRFAPRKIKESLVLMNKADPRFLDAAFETMESKYGSAENYLRDALGLDAEKLQKLKEIYVN